MAGGRPRLYTAEEFAKAVQAYIDDSEDKGYFPDEAGLILWLKIGETTYREYGEREGFREVVARARLLRESWLTRKMTAEPKLAQGCLNNLKQPKNGGYIDKPQNDGPRELTINLVGVGSDAFK